MMDEYNNRMIEPSITKGDRKKPLRIFHFPSLKKRIRAVNLEEATKKANK